MIKEYLFELDKINHFAILKLPESYNSVRVDEIFYILNELLSKNYSWLYFYNAISACIFDEEDYNLLRKIIFYFDDDKLVYYSINN